MEHYEFRARHCWRVHFDGKDAAETKNKNRAEKLLTEKKIRRQIFGRKIFGETKILAEKAADRLCCIVKKKTTDGGLTLQGKTL